MNVKSILEQTESAARGCVQRVVRWLGEHNGWRVVMVEHTTRRKITLTTGGMTKEKLYDEERRAVSMAISGIIADVGPEKAVGITITTISRKPRLI